MNGRCGFRDGLPGPATAIIFPSIAKKATAPGAVGKPSSLLDTCVIYCGDCLEQLQTLPPSCVDLICIDPWCEEIEQSFDSNRNTVRGFHE